MTFSAMDPKRGDGKMYDLIFEPTNDGDIVTYSTATTVEWSV